MRVLRLLLLAAALSAPALAEPDSAQGWLDAALTAVTEGRLADALVACDRAVALDPASPDAWNRRAFVLLRLGRPAEAEADATRALERAPDFAKSMLVRGIARYRTGQFALAVEDLLRGHAAAPQLAHADSLEALAYSLYRVGRCAESLPWWDKAVAADSDEPNHVLIRGVCREEGGDVAGAIADYDATLRLQPGNAIALRHRGFLHAAAGRHAEADRDLTEVVRIDPADSETWGRLITARTALGDRLGAIAAIDRYVALLPDVAWGWNARGLQHLEDGATDAAITALSTAIRLDPSEPRYFNNRGEAYRRMGRWAEALADDDRCRALLTAGQRPHYEYRAEALSRLGRAPVTPPPVVAPSPVTPSTPVAVSRYDYLQLMRTVAADVRRSGTLVEEAEVTGYTRFTGVELEPGAGMGITVFSPMNADVTVRFHDGTVCPYVQRPAGSLVEVRACVQKNTDGIRQWRSFTIERGVAADPVLFVLVR